MSDFKRTMRQLVQGYLDPPEPVVPPMAGERYHTASDDVKPAANVMDGYPAPLNPDLPPPEGGIQWGPHMVVSIFGKLGQRYFEWHHDAWHEVVSWATSA